MLDDIVLTKQALKAARAAGDDAEVHRLDEQERVQWRKWEVFREIDSTMARQDAARAAGDDAAVHRLEEVMRPLRVKLDELRQKDPTDPQTRAAAQMEVIEVIATLLTRQDAARAAGDDAEVHRLDDVIRPLRVRRDEIDDAVLRRHAALDLAESRRIVEEAAALWDRLVAFWRAKPFDPHTI